MPPHGCIPGDVLTTLYFIASASGWHHPGFTDKKSEAHRGCKPTSFWFWSRRYMPWALRWLAGGPCSWEDRHTEEQTQLQVAGARTVRANQAIHHTQSGRLLCWWAMKWLNETHLGQPDSAPTETDVSTCGSCTQVSSNAAFIATSSLCCLWHPRKLYTFICTSSRLYVIWKLTTLCCNFYCASFKLLRRLEVFNTDNMGGISLAFKGFLTCYPCCRYDSKVEVSFAS